MRRKSVERRRGELDKATPLFWNPATSGEERKRRWRRWKKEKREKETKQEGDGRCGAGGGEE